MTPKNPQESNQNQEPEDDYVLTLYEVCEMLGKSSRTITRYVQRHILHPRALKSCQGTLEYRFSKREIRQVRDSEKIAPYLLPRTIVPSPLARLSVGKFCGIQLFSFNTGFCAPAVSGPRSEFPHESKSIPSGVPAGLFPLRCSFSKFCR